MVPTPAAAWTGGGGAVTTYMRPYPRRPEEAYPKSQSLCSPITMQATRDTKQDMQTRGHMNHKMSRKLHVRKHVWLILRDKLDKPVFQPLYGSA